MNERDWLTAYTEQFYKQAQEDAEYSKRFMERLRQSANTNPNPEVVTIYDVWGKAETIFVPR